MQERTMGPSKNICRVFPGWLTHVLKKFWAFGQHGLWDCSRWPWFRRLHDCNGPSFHFNRCEDTFIHLGTHIYLNQNHIMYDWGGRRNKTMEHINRVFRTIWFLDLNSGTIVLWMDGYGVMLKEACLLPSMFSVFNRLFSLLKGGGGGEGPGSLKRNN